MYFMEISFTDLCICKFAFLIQLFLSLSVMVPRGVAHYQISDFWSGCRFVIVSGSRRVLSLWLFYMQASVS